MRRSPTARLAALIGVVLAVSTGLAPAAVASTPTARTGPTCGAVLTADTRLTRDLVCRSGPALTIGANLRLDLGGHRIVGPGASSGAQGVVLTENALDVTITNGTLKGWGSGVARTEEGTSQRVVLKGVRLVQNKYALPVSISMTLEVSGSVLNDNEHAISGFQTAAITVDRSSFARNGVGVRSTSSGYVTITRSTFVGNETAVECYEVQCEISRAVLRDNSTGIYNWWSSLTLRSSTVSGADIGVFLQFGSSGTLESNTFRDNATGVEASYLDGTVVRGNTFRGNDTGFLSRTIEDGVNQTSTVVESNTFSRNGDGIQSTQSGVHIGRNVATNNTGWGIYAELAVDLGGNVARRNGNEPQCVGVVCTPRP